MVTHQQLAHIWANNPEYKRTASRMFCENGIIYSHGYHFPIAKHVTNKQGQPAILFTLRDYSVSTSQHKAHVIRAIPDTIPVFKISHIIDNNNIFQEYVLRLATLSDEIKTTRKSMKRDRLILDFEKLRDEANAYAKFFGLKDTLPATLDYEQAQEEREKLRKKMELAKKREILKAKKAQQKYLEEWLSGDRDTVYYPGDSVFLRIEGDVIQTSKGAEFPVSHGKKILPIIRKCVKDKLECQNKTMRLGHFTIDLINSNGDVKAGCHTVQYSEIERIANLLNL
jgi:hypothetical protein